MTKTGQLFFFFPAFGALAAGFDAALCDWVLGFDAGCCDRTLGWGEGFCAAGCDCVL